MLVSIFFTNNPESQPEVLASKFQAAVLKAAFKSGLFYAVKQTERFTRQPENSGRK